MNTESLIINSPYEVPNRHWSQDGNGRVAQPVEVRRPAAYELYDTRNNTRRVELLDTVNRIRQRVDDWREAGWPSVTMITRVLLEHWNARGEWQLMRVAGTAGRGNIRSISARWTQSKR